VDLHLGEELRGDFVKKKEREREVSKFDVRKNVVLLFSSMPIGVYLVYTVEPHFRYSIGQKWLYLSQKLLKSTYGFPKTYM
jgi:hypothetical protein